MIKIFTLKSNATQNILSEYEEYDTHIELKNPVIVINIPGRTPQERPSIAFSPFLAFTEEFESGIKIMKEDILCITTPVIEMENQYNKMFGSGIQIPETAIQSQGDFLNISSLRK